MDEKLNRAWEEGYEAYRNEGTPEDNPYDAWTEEDLWNRWKEGYYDAAWDD